MRMRASPLESLTVVVILVRTRLYQETLAILRKLVKIGMRGQTGDDRKVRARVYAVLRKLIERIPDRARKGPR